jgi:hypothetical protein
MAASTYLDQVQQLYIAYFGRPADPIGQLYWATQIDAANGSIAAVQAGFSASTESQALFGNKSTIDKVTAIYQNVFNRSPDAAGLAFWVAQIDSGKVTQAQASWTIQQNAGAGDAATVQNKLTAAKAFTAQIDTAAEIQGYQGAGAAASGVAFLNTVTSVNATATAAVAAAPSALAAAVAAGGTVGTTFALTTGVDSLTGTANNDTFVGTVNDTATAQTLSAGDTINGGAGVDTLRVVLSNNAAATTPLNGVTITNVEKLAFQNVSASATSANVSAIAGVTTVSSVNSTAAVSFTGLAAGTEVILSGSATTAGGVLNFAQNTATDAVKVTIDGGVSGGTVQASAGTATTAAINSTGAANGTGTAGADTIKLTGGTNTLTTLSVNADAALRATLTASDFVATGAALTVTGAAAANLGTAGVFKTIDASASTGGVTVGVTAATTSFKGGAGNDTIVGTTPLLATATIDGGAGTDAVSALLINSTNAAIFKNFEVIDLNGATGTGLDAVLLTGSTLTGVSISGATASANYAFSNLVESATGFNVSVTGDNGLTNALGLGFTTASVAGTADVLNYSFAATAGTTIGAGVVTSQGIETINISSKGANTGLNSLTVVDNAAKSIVVTGEHALSLTVSGQAAASATASSALTSIDASAATGAVTITTAAVTTGLQSGITIKGGSAADTIVVATTNVTGSVGDTVTTGAGNDKVDVTAAALGSNFVSAPQFTTITDFAKGDSIQFAAGITAFTTTAVNVTAATSLLGALQIANSATANTVQWFAYGGDTYVVASAVATGGAQGTALDATDTVVKLSGIVNLATASDTAGLLTFA